VVRNQINIINNNQSQQIFSKAGFSTQPEGEYNNDKAGKSQISNKNKKYMMAQPAGPS